MRGLLLIWLATTAQAAEFKTPTAAELLKSAHGGTLVERIEKISHRLVGAPFADDPLGEGPHGEYDRDPLFRLDRFDCTTFVETVVALAVSKTPADIEKVLTRVRYRDGHAKFSHRNHFPDADWIPNNRAAGFVSDITAEIAGPLGVKTADVVVDRKAWYASLPETVLQGIPNGEHATKLAHLHAEGAHLAKQSVSTPYIELAQVLTRHDVPEAEQARRKAEETTVEEKYRALPATTDEAELKRRQEAQHGELVALRQSYALAEGEVDPEFIRRIPSGTILNVVRPNWRIAGTALSITHQGFVIHKGDGVYFRHGSRSGGERLKDVTLASYLKLCLLSPSIKGINLLRINEPR